MSERTFQEQMDLRSVAHAIVTVTDALLVLPKYDANLELIKSYQEQLDKLITEMRELVK